MLFNIITPPVPVFVPLDQIVEFIAQIPTTPVAGVYYLIADSTSSFQLKPYRTRVLLFDGTEFIVHQTPVGGTITVGGVVNVYSPGLGFMPVTSYGVSGATNASSGGGGGGGTPPADIAAGIDQSLDVDTIIANIGELSNTGVFVLDASGTATTTASFIPEELTALETEIHNKSLTELLYVRIDSVATATSSITIPPLSSRIVTGIKASSSFSVLSPSTTNYFVEYVLDA